MKINIDYSRDELLPEFAIKTLKDRYLTESEASPQDAFARAAIAFADDEAHAQRLYDYASKLWFMFATPLLSNGGTSRGLPISCFLNYVDDSREGLGDHFNENIWLSSTGGGIGSYWGNVRSQGEGTAIGNKTTGVIPFMHVVDSQMLAFNQGATRRGSAAAWIDISHPEIHEFLNMRRPTGGDLNRKNLNLHHGVVLTDAFMHCVQANADWDLIDPNSGRVHETVKARALWADILRTRLETGEPYIMWKDVVYEALPKSLKEAGLEVHHSNLCSEITLPTNKDRTAVCCLSSVNLELYDEWKDDEQFIEDLMRMLDNTLTVFINEAPDYLWRAVESARTERSVGLGAMGFHSYLQKQGVPFVSPTAREINAEIFGHIFIETNKASRKLAVERGEPELMQGTGHRFAHKTAIAPNASSSIICGNTSPSIEPLRGNCYVQKTGSGTHIVKNKYLEEVLEKFEMNTPDVWKDINAHRGSVQHLDLPQMIKDVFLTAIEIPQEILVLLAGDRQLLIDQAQSLNLFFPADADAREVNKVHMLAWEKRLKTLYYCRSEAVKRAEVVDTRVARFSREDYEGCAMCEG